MHSEHDTKRKVICIYLEYMSGGSLTSVFKAMEVPPAEGLISRYARDILEAIVYSGDLRNIRKE